MRALERVHAFIDLGGDGIEYCCTVVATSGVAGSFLALATVFYDQRRASSIMVTHSEYLCPCFLLSILSHRSLDLSDGLFPLLHSSLLRLLCSSCGPGF